MVFLRHVSATNTGSLDLAPALAFAATRLLVLPIDAPFPLTPTAPVDDNAVDDWITKPKFKLGWFGHILACKLKHDLTKL